MSRLAEYTHFARFQILFQCTIATSSVRIQYISRLSVTLAHRFLNLLVIVGGTTNQVGYTMMRCLLSQLIVFRIKVQDTGKVRWVANVHCIGQSLYAGLRLILTALQIIIKHIIRVVSSNKALDRQSHLVTEQSRTDIAEVT